MKTATRSRRAARASRPFTLNEIDELAERDYQERLAEDAYGDFASERAAARRDRRDDTCRAFDDLLNAACE